jgi:ABC-2 family transporter
VSESVTVRDLITEQMRWDAAWYRMVPRADVDDLTRVCGPVFGPLPLPELTAYVDQLTQLDAVLLRIALANTAVPPLLVGSLDQVDEHGSRAELVRRLVDLGAHDRDLACRDRQRGPVRGEHHAVVHFGVGLHAKHTVGTVAFLLLVAATFLAMIQAFNAVFGVAVGRVVTLAFLMLQLVSSGGIYPVETTAKPFQIIHPFDPMTYAVNGLRELTVGGVETRLWVSIVVLCGILAVSLAASALAARRNRQYTMERLHPPIEV